MINFDNYTNENKTIHNKHWPYITDHPYRILIIGRSGSGKTNLLLHLIENRPDIGKIYLYTKDPYESKYQYLINKRESVGLNHFNDPKAFIDYSNDISKYKNIFAKGYVPNWSEEVFIISKIKNAVPWTYVVNDLNGEEIIESFYEKELQKSKRLKKKEFRPEKVLRKKVINYMSNGKLVIIHLIVGLIKNI